jgi:beta-glucosidase
MISKPKNANQQAPIKRWMSSKTTRISAIAGLQVFLGSLALAADPAATANPEIWPAGPKTVLIQPKTEQFIDHLLKSMTLEEKVGQMVQGDIASITPDDLHRYKLGSVLAGGLASPNNDVHAGPGDWLQLVDRYYRASIADRSPAHPPIPIIFGIDAVHGDAKVRGATIFPHNIGLGAAHDPALLQRIGQATAEEAAATGIDWVFAPTVAVVRDVRWGRSYESYSEDPALVAQYAPAMVTGIQGTLGPNEVLAQGRTLSSVKHFLGDGGTIDGRDQGDNLAPEMVLRDVHAAGYPPAIAAGAAIVMASYNGWHGVKLHASHSLITDVLKGRLGFNGFVVSDWNAQEEIPGCTKLSCPAMIMAGVDMAMAPDGWKQFYENTLAQVRSGVIPQTRIDDAVRRILRVKARFGLFDRKPPTERPGAGDFSGFGGAAHRALAREAVEKSLVLLKNEHHTLPLAPKGRFLVTGEGADDIGQQSGGWTVDWQGAHNQNADFPGATSIYGGIKRAVEQAGGAAILSPDGSFTERPDAAIVVFGETPYAEYIGDRDTVEFSPGDKHALALMKKLRAQNIPVVAVFLSGRPLWVNPEINASTAFVAAWLPGGEGEGVADLLFQNKDGKAAHDFTGTLPFSWPASGMPVAFDTAGHVTGALFPRGYGLTYASDTSVAELSEDAKLPADHQVLNTLFHAGHVTAPWSIIVADDAAQVRLTMQEQASPAGAVTATINGDAASVRWAGGQKGIWAIDGGEHPVDFSGLARDHKSLTLLYRLDRPLTGTVTISMGCGGECRGTIDISHAIAAKADKSWQTLSIPLACFADQGTDFTHVLTPLALASSEPNSLSIRQAMIGSATENQSCPAL